MTPHGNLKIVLRQSFKPKDPPISTYVNLIPFSQFLTASTPVSIHLFFIFFVHFLFSRHNAFNFLLSAGAVEYGISAEELDPHLTSVLHMTLKILIVSTPSLVLLPSLLWPRVVAPDRFLSMGQIQLFDI